jgi:hypothetical protein
MLLAGLRPVLVSSQLQDPVQKIGFQDDHWMKVEGGMAVVDLTETAIYMAMGLRNVGSGLAVLDGWDYSVDRELGGEYRDPSIFRRLTRDIYVPPGDIGFWQGAIRDVSDEAFGPLKEAISTRKLIMIDVLYRDHEGGQRTISRFGLIPREDGQWLTASSRHWNLDRDDPR